MILTFCCLWGACGKKAPPRPPRSPELPKVKELDAVIIETGVQLSWSIPFTAEGVDRFNLFRSKPEPVEEACPACPRGYELIRTIKVESGQTYFQLFDRNIAVEGRYYYRVIALDERSRPGPDSNEAEVIVKWRQNTVIQEGDMNKSQDGRDEVGRISHVPDFRLARPPVSPFN
jgi:hypothetical protein